jgi:hypothetical protein
MQAQDNLPVVSNPSWISLCHKEAPSAVLNKFIFQTEETKKKSESLVNISHPP